VIERCELGPLGCHELRVEVDCSIYGLRSIGDALRVRENAAVRDVDGLSGLRTIEAGLVFEGNAALRNLDGLAGLEAMGGDLVIIDNQSLPTCEADAVRVQLSPLEGDVCIQGNRDDGCDDVTIGDC
jgi:hypothetical protein